MDPRASLTFANPMGEWLAPFLLALRATGFFEAYVYMPVMTLFSVFLYLWLVRRLNANGGLARHRRPRLWRAAYFVVCFLFANVIAVAFKTLIVEEMDYPDPVWFAALVSPLHFYIASVTGAYLWLLARDGQSLIDRALAVYVQLGLLGGYAVCVYRLRNEPFSLLDLTGGFGAIILAVVFLAYNWDVLVRLIRRTTVVNSLS